MLAAPVQRSLAVLDMAQAGRFAEIRILFVPQLRALVSAEGRQVAWEAAAHSASSVRLSGCAVSCGLASTGYRNGLRRVRPRCSGSPIC